MPDRNSGDLDGELVDLLTRIDRLTNDLDVSAVLRSLLDAYELKSFAYLGAGLTDIPDERPFLAVTYSPEWVEHYKGKRFVEVDPAIQIGLRRMLPIDWSEFDRRDKKVGQLFGEANEYGLGRQGLSFPVHGRRGDRALVSITSDASDREWLDLRLHYLRDFQLVALHVHQAILRLHGEKTLFEGAVLSPRERECLLWIAEGKTYWECARILGLSEHTVRCYLESARHKLHAANTTHAVKRARLANLLSGLP